MARCRSNTVVVAVAATATIMMMMIMSPGSNASRVDQECPSGLVYPYWSTCRNPAVYVYDGGVYELGAASGDEFGTLLAPEWDETNATYYVRLAEDGATYSFTHLTKERRFAVAQTDSLLIRNAETGRYLAWRQEGDEYFLIEQEAVGASFQFSEDADVVLPCPLILGARCEAYQILEYNNTSQGLTPYVEDSVTYFKLSDNSSALPFFLRTTTTSTSKSVDIKMKLTA